MIVFMNFSTKSNKMDRERTNRIQLSIVGVVYFCNHRIGFIEKAKRASVGIAGTQAFSMGY